MTALHVRAAILLGLAALGLTLAWAGTALGIGGQVTEDPSPTGLTVTDENVTLSSDDRTVTVVDDVSAVRSITVESTTDGIDVRTDQQRLLTDAQRERATSIVQNNDTIAEYLDALGEYNFSVNPVFRRSASDMQQISFNVSESEMNRSGDSFTIDTSNVTVDNPGDSVEITRADSQIDERAVVRVLTVPSEDIRYSIEVDLKNGTVVDLTNWE